MIRDIVRDTFFLAQPSVPAQRKDVPVAEDLIDTLKANADRCVGLAANMIGERKCIIAIRISGLRWSIATSSSRSRNRSSATSPQRLSSMRWTTARES